MPEIKRLLILTSFVFFAGAGAWGGQTRMDEGDTPSDSQKVLSERQQAYTQIYNSIVANPSKTPYENQMMSKQVLRSVNEETDSLVKSQIEDRNSYLYNHVFSGDGRVLDRKSADASAEIARLKSSPQTSKPREQKASTERVPASVQANPSDRPWDVVVDGSNVPKELVFPGPKKNR